MTAPDETGAGRMGDVKFISAASLAVSLVVLAVKFLAFRLTGGVALYSDALESLVNVATALVAIVAVRFAARPPDPSHLYGHAKAEYLSAAVIGALIVLAALAILREAYDGWLDPKPLDAPALGIAVGVFATALNAAWSYALIRAGRTKRSATLEADGRHLMSDVVTSAGVLAGVALVALTGFLRLDAIIAALVALSVLWSGLHVLRENAGALMDEAPPAAGMEKIDAALAAALQAGGAGVVEAHDLRAPRRRRPVRRSASGHERGDERRARPRALRQDRGGRRRRARRADADPRRARERGEGDGPRARRLQGGMRARQDGRSFRDR